MQDSLPEAVLLDRDGTINRKAPEGEYITRPEQLELLPGAAEAVRILNRLGVPVAVVTNQRGIALGRMTECDLEAVHVRLRELLSSSGARLDVIFHCPHDKGMCRCRKPASGLLERACNHLALKDLRGSTVVGDSWTDVEAARSVGAHSVLLCAHGQAVPPGTETAVSLLEAVHAAVEHLRCPLRLPLGVWSRSSL
jgi:D-glycero-D-manno-heptose 1,7-bisphosphate phosphatase